jgi:hypothetical protein
MLRTSAADTKGWRVPWTRSRISGAGPPRYPPAAPLRLPWTQESLSGYTGPTRVDVDISLGTRQEIAALLETREALIVEGAMALQACSDSVCWPPRMIRVAWQFDLIRPDLERVPEPMTRAGVDLNDLDRKTMIAKLCAVGPGISLARWKASPPMISMLRRDRSDSPARRR